VGLNLARRTKRVIAAQPAAVILVGHSYGGVVVTQAGNDPVESPDVSPTSARPTTMRSAWSRHSNSFRTTRSTRSRATWVGAAPPTSYGPSRVSGRQNRYTGKKDSEARCERATQRPRIRIVRGCAHRSSSLRPQTLTEMKPSRHPIRLANRRPGWRERHARRRQTCSDCDGCEDQRNGNHHYGIVRFDLK
jgi:hypothetical protein